MIELFLHKDGSERVPYASSQFPLHLSACSLSMYPGMRCVSHWHNDLEFAVVRKGRCVYRVNGLPTVVSAGEGVYITPRSVHSVEALSGEDCEYLCVVFPLALLSASATVAAAVQAHLEVHEPAHCVHLDPAAERQKAVIQVLLRLEDIVRQNGKDRELLCLSALYQLLADLGAAVRGEQALPKTDRHLAQIKEMIGYIQLHADRKLTLQDIARAGKLSRSSCESAFTRVLHVSPVQYLLNYRLEKGMELLRSTPLSVTDIAQRCGFCSGSYFAEQLRRHAGCSPVDYRKKRRTAEPCAPAEGN